MLEPSPVKRLQWLFAWGNSQHIVFVEWKTGNEANWEHFSFQFSEIMRVKEHLCSQGAPLSILFWESETEVTFFFFSCLACSDETLLLSLQADIRVWRGLCNHIQTWTWLYIMFEKFPIFRGCHGVCIVFCVLPVCH